MDDTVSLIEQADTRFSQQQFGEAAQLYAAVLALDPRNIHALFQSARLAVMQGRHADGAQGLKNVLAVQPAHAGAWQGLAYLHGQAGRLAEAAGCYERVVQLQPDDPVAAYNLGAALQQVGRTAEAEAALRRALDLDPRFAHAANNLGNLLSQQGRHAEAEACYRQALAAKPDLPGVHYNLALALQALGHREVARDVLRNFLDGAPGDGDAWLALGTLHQDLRELDAAIDCYRRAAAASPDMIKAHFNLAIALRDLQRKDEALDAFRIVLQRALAQPGVVDASLLAGAYFGIADLLKASDRLDEWIAHFNAVPTDLRGDVRHAHYGFDIAMHFGDFATAQRELGRLVRDVDRLDEIGPLQRLLAMLQYHDLPQADLLRFYRRFDELVRTYAGGQLVTPARRPIAGRRIRIGYLSPDFKVHIMGLLMYEVLSRHDRQRFEIHLYALNDTEDELTRRFRDICDGYTVLDAPLSIDNAKRIARDDLDLLVDLGGHMAGSRPLILAYKPAPMQVTHLGYHGSIGLDTVDFKITDAYADLPGNAQYLVEDLLPMRGCLMPFLRRAPSPGGKMRAELGIADDAIVFGVFVNPLKLGVRCLAAWKAIVERVDNAVLAFSPHYTWARDATLRLMEGIGIARERIAFISSGDEGDFGRWRYRLVDIVLDTFPYTGGDTTVAALDMGVPVVSLCGERQSERVTYSILMNLGVEGGIAHSEEQYVDIACRLASEPALRAQMSARIVERLAKSPIGDMAIYTRNLEDAFLDALARKGLT